MRNYLADLNLLAVSTAKEAALNSEQTLAASMLIAKSDILQLAPRREDNRDELTGKEEPDTVYDLGSLTEGTLNFEKAQAQHFAFGLAFGLGVDTPASWGTGYKHVITPIATMDLPSFTAAMRLGKTVFKRRFGSMHVDQLTASFVKDSWARLSLNLRGTGKYADNMHKETVQAAYNATSLTLAANGVEGANAAERLDNVHQIRVKVPTTNEWQEVSFSAVSGATPAVITITAPGGVATACEYEILYIPTESAWMSFPARVSESPLRVTDLVLKVGGKWNGSNFLGGRTLGAEIESIEYSLNNQLAIEFRVGGTGAYANYVQRGGRIQTLKLNREMRDFIVQQKVKDNEYFGVYAKATGAEWATGYNYYVEMVFPRCNVLNAPVSVNGRILAEAGDLIVLQDDTYGSVRAEVANQVTAYA